MKLSIIIPVYQVKDTLRRCLDSIVAQSFRDWQAILVDDVSTDGSVKICNEYARQEGRIQLVSLKRHAGLSAARNAGLAKAHGEYITFIDSDDYLQKDTLKTLMEELAIHPDYDMLEYSFYQHYGCSRQTQVLLARHEYSDMQQYWLETKAWTHTYAWNKIYRREVWEGLRFPEGRTFEDSFTLPQVLKRCQLVATTDTGLYYYTDNTRGITHNANGKDLGNLLEAHLIMLRRLWNNKKARSSVENFDKLMGEYYASVLNIQLDVFHSTGKYRRDFPILPYHNTIKLKALQLLGLPTLCKIHKLVCHSHSSVSL